MPLPPPPPLQQPRSGNSPVPYDPAVTPFSDEKAYIDHQFLRSVTGGRPPMALTPASSFSGRSAADSQTSSHSPTSSGGLPPIAPVRRPSLSVGYSRSPLHSPLSQLPRGDPAGGSFSRPHSMSDGALPAYLAAGLAPEWTARISQTTNRVYYVHKPSGATQWEPPQGATSSSRRPLTPLVDPPAQSFRSGGARAPSL
jgi:hypothetical protein